ncbi:MULTISPECIES: hypothetical protein [Aeromonas]|uniref:AbiTii domain-containing protein n=1 Tax=Aeromonas bestiarum TaxID=105751 RepID=A0AAW7I7A8_9GAMM|nr:MULTISPECIES: hypothetical protein [Aeromonas]MCE9968099.1 hypothetical protein [Aeromonas salmonicida]MDM5069285.1 hypothetical protein [Aeromonas salmonicida]MDM5115883.1 hypothetical protein [Aeromonas salmonicida]MDM5142033.1 hypothetical protein [Aeromonas bestiarum]
MPALIPELIAMASEPTIKTTDLLRKALVAARLLKQPEWATWLGHELQGYPDYAELPPYRRIRGELKVRNPLRGLIPLHSDSPEWTDEVSTCLCGKSVGELEVLASSEHGIWYRFSPHAAAEIMAMQVGEPMTPVVVLATSQLRGILELIRDKVLIWALDLAEAGIEGEGMSFTAQEQQQAQQLAPVSIHIEGGFHGGQLMASSPGGQQQQTITDEQKAAALDALLPWLEQLIAQGTLLPSTLTDLQASHAALQTLARAPTPSWPIIGMLAGSVRAVLQNAGGGVLASQALGWLATLSGG